MKINTLEELQTILEDEKQKGKKIVHCHGCFDLLHYGHLVHFKDAKAQGDILVVTLTQDRYVNKGKGRPFFNENQRLEFISALEVVDYAALNRWPSAGNTIRMLAPDLYVKGKEYASMRDELKMKEELDALESVGGTIYYSQGIVFSSTTLLNQGLIPDLIEQSKEKNAHVVSSH